MNIKEFTAKKAKSQKISLLTCYDYPSAIIASQSKLDAVLVGDSVAMVVHGYPTTIHATIEMMLLHTSAVARGIGEKFIISDLPFLEHKISPATTVINCQKLLRCGAHAIKIEGADDDTLKTIAHLTQSSIPVMGHLGLTPQAILKLGSYKVQGRKKVEHDEIVLQAKKLQDAGCFAIVIECVPTQLAAVITQSLDIPVIGIGAGSHTDGQVLVWHDLLGLQQDLKPKFVKIYCKAQAQFLDAINLYVSEVTKSCYPNDEHSYQ